MPGKKILLVEGTDDEHVLTRLCGNRGVLQSVVVKPHGGVDHLLESFPVQLRASEDGDIIGIVVDADTDLNTRWQALRDRLLGAGYQDVPRDLAPDGTILDPPPGTLLPRVGVWIMPDNQSKGILEDFLRFLVPADNRLFEHVKTSVAGIPEKERRLSQLSESKAIIHTWLAWQKEPGKPLGTAITAKFLNPNVAQVDVLVAWLKRLFFP